MTVFSKKLTHSLQWRLLLTLTAVCLLFSGLVASFSFYQSYRQAQDLQDTKLANLVSLAKSHDLSIDNDQIDINLRESSQNASTNLGFTGLKTDIEQDIATNQTLIYWLDDARLTPYFSPTTLADLAKQPDGLYERQGRHGLWRLYLYTQPNTQKTLPIQPPAHSKITATHHRPDTISKPFITERRLIIGELLDIRNQLAWQSAKKILFPLLLLIPLLLLVIVITVHQVFRPLGRITQLLDANLSTHLSDTISPVQVSARIPDNQSLTTSPTALENTHFLSPQTLQKLPSEILPFIQVIQTQMQRLLDSLALNERFVSNASHQLRTPMTAILLQAEQIKLTDNATPAQIREQSRAIDRLLDSIKRNNQLINQLLTLSKSEQKNQTLPLAPFSPSQVITDVLLDCYPIASQKAINLGVHQLQDLTIAIAELHFKIIVQNLLDNAIKYTPHGGRVDISLFADHAKTVLQVQDSGMGIDETELDNILEPFYRSLAVITSPATASLAAPLADPPTVTSTQPIEGFGLGLAIVNNLVTASHATLTIANHRNLDPDSPFYRPELARQIKIPSDELGSNATTPDPKTAATEEFNIATPTTLLEKIQVPAFTSGLMVQICW